MNPLRYINSKDINRIMIINFIIIYVKYLVKHNEKYTKIPFW